MQTPTVHTTPEKVVAVVPRQVLKIDKKVLVGVAVGVAVGGAVVFGVEKFRLRNKLVLDQVPETPEPAVK